MFVYRGLSRLAVATVGALLVLVALAASLPTHAEKPVARPQQDYAPCGLVARRTIEPRVIAEGDTLNVKVTYDYNCIGGLKRINFILVVETTISAQRLSDRGQLQTNLKEGLKNFVNVTNFNNGSCGGLTLVGDEYTNRVPLRCDRDGKEQLLQQIELISLKPLGSSAGFGGAIRDAVGRLPTNVADAAENWLIIFDRGAPETIPGNPEPPVTRPEACTIARRSKVNVAVVGHEDSQGRMISCATRGFYRGSSGSKAPDLPNLFEGLADAVLRGKQANETEYLDFAYSAYFKYVEGSGKPREPDLQRGNEISWKERAARKPPGGYTIEYQWEAVPDSAPAITKVSNGGASIAFVWPDNTFDDWRMDDPENNPEVCIHQKNRRQQCAAFERALTPSPTPLAETPTPTTAPPTNTPVPTTAVPPTLTPEAPTAVPVTNTPPPPSPTPVPGIYLPALLRTDMLGGV